MGAQKAQQLTIAEKAAPRDVKRSITRCSMHRLRYPGHENWSALNERKFHRADFIHSACCRARCADKHWPPPPPQLRKYMGTYISFFSTQPRKGTVDKFYSRHRAVCRNPRVAKVEGRAQAQAIPGMVYGAECGVCRWAWSVVTRRIKYSNHNGPFLWLENDLPVGRGVGSPSKLLASWRATKTRLLLIRCVV